MFKTLKRKDNQQGFLAHFTASSISLALISQPVPTTSGFLMTPAFMQNRKSPGATEKSRISVAGAKTHGIETARRAQGLVSCKKIIDRGAAGEEHSLGLPEKHLP